MDLRNKFLLAVYCFLFVGTESHTQSVHLQDSN